MTQLEDYVAPPAGGEGDQLSAKDVVGHTLVLQPLKIVSEVATKFGTKDAISVNVADVSDRGKVYRSVLWFNGAIVDGLRGSIGKTIAARVSWASSKAGNEYLIVESVDTDEKTKAAKWLSENPTAFAPEVGDPATGNGGGEEPF
jgi:hypothetical protein